jgi:hypothetical protein
MFKHKWGKVFFMLLAIPILYTLLWVAYNLALMVWFPEIKRWVFYNQALKVFSAVLLINIISTGLEVMFGKKKNGYYDK